MTSIGKVTIKQQRYFGLIECSGRCLKSSKVLKFENVQGQKLLKMPKYNCEHLVLHAVNVNLTFGIESNFLIK